MIIFFFAVLIGISFFCVAYLFLDATRGQASDESRRLRERLTKITATESKKNPQTYLQTAQLSEISALNQLLKHNTTAKSIYSLLIFSNWNISVGAFLLIEALIGYIGYRVADRLTDVHFAAVGAGVVIAFIPYMMLVVNKRRYIGKFTTHFPDALMMIKNALRAGQGVQAGMQMVAEEGPHPVNKEFSRVVHEIEMGSSIGEALSELYKRLQTLDLRIFTLGVFIQQEVGGNLGELMGQVEATIRERLSLSREIRVLAAQGKMSGLVLMLLPVVVVFALKLVNPGYFDPLLTSELGKKIIVGAIIFQLIGCYAIHRITSFSITS